MNAGLWEVEKDPGGCDLKVIFLSLAVWHSLRVNLTERAL